MSSKVLLQKSPNETRSLQNVSHEQCHNAKCPTGENPRKNWHFSCDGPCWWQTYFDFCAKLQCPFKTSHHQSDTLVWNEPVLTAVSSLKQISKICLTTWWLKRKQAALAIHNQIPFCEGLIRRLVGVFCVQVANILHKSQSPSIVDAEHCAVSLNRCNQNSTFPIDQQQNVLIQCAELCNLPPCEESAFCDQSTENCGILRKKLKGMDSCVSSVWKHWESQEQLIWETWICARILISLFACSDWVFKWPVSRTHCLAVLFDHPTWKKGICIPRVLVQNLQLQPLTCCLISMSCHFGLITNTTGVQPRHAHDSQLSCAFVHGTDKHIQELSRQSLVFQFLIWLCIAGHLHHSQSWPLQTQGLQDKSQFLASFACEQITSGLDASMAWDVCGLVSKTLHLCFVDRHTCHTQYVHTQDLLPSCPLRAFHIYCQWLGQNDFIEWNSRWPVMALKTISISTGTTMCDRRLLIFKPSIIKACYQRNITISWSLWRSQFVRFTIQDW